MTNWAKRVSPKIMNLIDSLIKDGWLRTSRIIKAFQEIKRADFIQPQFFEETGAEQVPEDSRQLAELNESLPIGYGQTISQPLVVAFMIEQLEPKPGDKILDIGSGSGWTTALLAYIVSQQGNPESAGREADSPEGCIRNPKQIPNSNVQNSKQNLKGKVIAIEVIPELKEFGEKNVAKYNFIEKGLAEFICVDGSKGYKKEAPFDGILASASAKKIPETWKEQLKIGAKIVTPVGNSIWVLEKKSEKKFEEREFPGFVFVPLIQK